MFRVLTKKSRLSRYMYSYLNESSELAQFINGHLKIGPRYLWNKSRLESKWFCIDSCEIKPPIIIIINYHIPRRSCSYTIQFPFCVCPYVRLFTCSKTLISWPHTTNWLLEKCLVQFSHVMLYDKLEHLSNFNSKLSFSIGLNYITEKIFVSSCKGLHVWMCPYDINYSIWGFISPFFNFEKNSL